MDMIGGIGSAGIDVGGAQFSQQYNNSVMKMTMDLQAQAAREIMDMLPQQLKQPGSTPAGPPLGNYIDVYA